MKTPLFITTLLATTLITGSALADDDCHNPVADWQSREVLRQMLEAEGWKVHRIKVDEGCYEVKGLDQNGNKVKAEFFPATLRLRKLETKFKENAAIPDGLPSLPMQKSREKRNNRDNHDNGEKP
jgi:hypothetical protein